MGMRSLRNRTILGGGSRLWYRCPFCGCSSSLYILGRCRTSVCVSLYSVCGYDDDGGGGAGGSEYGDDDDDVAEYCGLIPH